MLIRIRLKLILMILIVLGCRSIFAQNAAFNGFCVKGATNAITSGLPSVNTLQGIVPGGPAGCLVHVYLTGTVTPATIYADSTGTTLSNPFRASLSGQWLFYASSSQAYDVVMSGGLPPNAYVTPVTLTGLNQGGGGSGGGVSSINGRTGAVTGAFFFQGTWNIATTYDYGDVVNNGNSLFISIASPNLGNIPNVSSYWLPFTGNVGQLSGSIFLPSTQFYGAFNVNDGSLVNDTGKNILWSSSINADGDQLETQATIIQSGAMGLSASNTWSLPGKNGYPYTQFDYYFNIGASAQYYDSWQEQMTMGSTTASPTNIYDNWFCNTINPSGCLPRNIDYNFPANSQIVYESTLAMTVKGPFHPNGGIFGSGGALTGILYGNGTSNPTSATTANVASLLQTASGCTTSGYVYSPQSNTCIVGGGSGTSFNSITSGTNTSAAMIVSTGASLGTTSGGTIQATSLIGSTPYVIGANFSAPGVTLDNGTPQYSTEVSGNSESINDYTNGLSNGPMAINYNRYAGGDYNPFPNMYNNFRTFTSTASDEGTGDGEGRFYSNAGDANQYEEYTGVINGTPSQPVAYGPATLTLTNSQTGVNVASTDLIDVTDVTNNTVSAVSTGTQSTPFTATLSTAVAASTSATLTTDLCVLSGGSTQTCTAWTNSPSNPVPQSKTFTISTSTALTAGERIQFVDTNSNLAEATTVVTAGTLSGGSQSITAYLQYPHLSGTQIYAGGLAGDAIEFTSDTHNGQQYAFHIYGTPTTTTALVATRCIGNVYCQFAQPGSVHIYPAATLAENIASGSTWNGTYAVIVPPVGAFTNGHTVANPGMPSNTDWIKKVQIYEDNPYANRQGIYYNLSGNGMNWTNGSSAFWNLQFGFGNGTGQPVDLLKVSGNNLSVGAGFDFPSQLAGSHVFPSIGGSNCFFCISVWDTADSGAPTTQDIFLINGSSGYGQLSFYNTDNSLRYSGLIKQNGGHTVCDNSGNCGSINPISGLTAGYIPLAGSATTITGNSHINDGITNAGELTASEPIVVIGSVNASTGFFSEQNNYPVQTDCPLGLAWTGTCILINVNNPAPNSGSAASTNILTLTSEGAGNGALTLSSPGSISISAGNGENILIGGGTFDGGGNLAVGAGITSGQRMEGKTFFSSINSGGTGVSCAAGGITANSWALDQNGQIGYCNGTIFLSVASATYCASNANPAACAGNINGFFVVAAASTTATVDTTSVDATSVITVQEDDSLGAVLGVTCNTTANYARPTSRVSGTSFTVTASTAPVTNPSCYSFTIIH